MVKIYELVRHFARRDKALEQGHVTVMKRVADRRASLYHWLWQALARGSSWYTGCGFHRFQSSAANYVE